MPHRDITVNWQPISLLFKNQPPEGSDYYGPVMKTHKMLRVLEAVRADAPTPEAGNHNVFKLYWELGARIHHDRDYAFDVADALTAVGLDAAHGAAADDESWDEVIRSKMDAGLALVGNDVGTPIIATENSSGDQVGYFGPVITKIPPTEQSLKMWDALMTMMDIDGFFELKKTRTEGPDFGPRPDPV
ncbi:MAG: disulfide bond formation protein DsbA [Ilumatobacter sp.]